MRVAFVLGAAAAFAAAAACSSFSASGGDSSSADAGSDDDASVVTTSDSGAPDASCPYDVAANPNDVATESFVASACDGWNANLDGTVEPVAVECGRACRFCAGNSGGNGYELSGHLSSFNVEGGAFTFTAWIRDNDAGNNATYHTDLVIYTSDPTVQGGQATTQHLSTNGFAPTWTEMTNTYTTAEPLNGVLVYVNADGLAPNGCFEFANARFTKEQ